MKNPEVLVFNPFQVNTYIIPCGEGQCIIVDAACAGEPEEQQLAGFLASHGLTPVMLLNTHCHIDHVAGNAFVSTKYGLTPLAHPDSGLIWPSVGNMAAMFGIDAASLQKPGDLPVDLPPLAAGNTLLELRHTPGHAAGSICLVNHGQRYVITGDVLFRDSIGRTDLPTGDFDTLYNSITTQLFTLPDDYIAYPGHGPQTTIGYEKRNNPFLS